MLFLTLFFLVLRNVRIFALRRQVLRTAGKATSLFRITRRQYEDAAALTFGLSFYSFLRIVILNFVAIFKSTPPLFRFPCAPRCCLFTASRCSASFVVSFAASCSSACGISLFRLTTSRVRLGLCFFFCCSGAFFCRWLVLLLLTLHSVFKTLKAYPAFKKHSHI